MRPARYATTGCSASQGNTPGKTALTNPKAVLVERQIKRLVQIHLHVERLRAVDWIQRHEAKPEQRKRELAMVLVDKKAIKFAWQRREELRKANPSMEHG